MLPAKLFFDSHVEEEYMPDEWDCELPLEKLHLEEYIESGDCPALEWLQVDITDRESGNNRRFVKQYWSGNSLLAEWSGLLDRKALCQIIIDTLESDHVTHSLIKMGVATENVSIVSHCRIKGNEDESLEWIDVPNHS